MKQMNLTAKFLATSVLYLSMAAIGQAQQFPPPPMLEGGKQMCHPIPPPFAQEPIFIPKEFGMRLPPFLRAVSLSERQQDLVFDILHKYAPTERESEKALRKSSEALRALGNTDRYDEGAAQSLAASIGKAFSDLAMIHSQIEHQIYELLTQEQRSRIKQMEDDLNKIHVGKIGKSE